MLDFTNFIGYKNNYSKKVLPNTFYKNDVSCTIRLLNCAGGFFMIIGYARVSTVDQNLDRQIILLSEYGCEKNGSREIYWDYKG
jgi:hypothetical protein